MDWKTNYLKNKNTLCTESTYFIGGEKMTRSSVIAIPPYPDGTVHIVTESGKLYTNVCVEDWKRKKMSAEEYLDTCLRIDDVKLRAKVLKTITWTPTIEPIEPIDIVMIVKDGKINLKEKL